jgi:hypothetical protein
VRDAGDASGYEATTQSSSLLDLVLSPIFMGGDGIDEATSSDTLDDEILSAQRGAYIEGTAAIL